MDDLAFNFPKWTGHLSTHKECNCDKVYFSVDSYIAIGYYPEQYIK